MTVESVAFFAIVNHGIGQKVLKIAKQHGTGGGTLVLCEGTIPNKFLNLMGLDESKKEMMITLAPKEYEKEIQEKITEKMKLDKKGLGILFSADTSSVYGSRLFNRAFEEEGENMSEYQLLVTIVDRDSGDDVVSAARNEGAKGATILHGRGTGTTEISKLFNIEIQPEKEIVLLVVESEKVKSVSENIHTAMGLDKPGSGVVFSIPVNQVTGLVQNL